MDRIALQFSEVATVLQSPGWCGDQRPCTVLLWSIFSYLGILCVLTRCQHMCLF